MSHVSGPCRLTAKGTFGLSQQLDAGLGCQRGLSGLSIPAAVLLVPSVYPHSYPLLWIQYPAAFGVVCVTGGTQTAARCLQPGEGMLLR